MSVEPPPPDAAEVNRILDLALTAGEEVLGAGAGSADAAASMEACAYAAGLDRVAVDVTFVSLSVTWTPDTHSTPVTRRRVVTARELDYTRLTRVHRVLRELSRGRLTHPEAARRLEQARSSDYPYGRRTAESALAGLAGGVVLLLGGSLLGALVALATTYLVLVVNRMATSRGLPPFFGNAFAAATVTATATACYALGVPVATALVVAGGIIALLPSVSLLSAVQDALSGYSVTAAGRLVEVLVLLGGIATGVGLVLSLANGLGVPLRDITASPPPAEPWLRILAGALVSALFLVSVYAPLRLLPSAALVGLLSSVMFLGVDLLGLGPVFAVGVSAVVIGTLAVLLAERQQVPSLVLAVAGFMPLLPGLAIYQGIFQLSQGNSDVGIVTVVGAVGTTTALAGGVVLGDLAATRVRRLRRLSLEVSTEATRRLAALGLPSDGSTDRAQGRSVASRFVGPSVEEARVTGMRRRAARRPDQRRR